LHRVVPAIDKGLDRYLTEAHPPLLAAVSDQTIPVTSFAYVTQVCED